MEAERLSPRFGGARSDVRAAQGHAKQAGAWPIPTVGLEREDFGSSVVITARRAHTTHFDQPNQWSSAVNAVRGSGRQRACKRCQAGNCIFNAGRVRLRLSRRLRAAEATQVTNRATDRDLGRAREDVRSARAWCKPARKGEHGGPSRRPRLCSGGRPRSRACRLRRGASPPCRRWWAYHPYSAVNPVLLKLRRAELDCRRSPATNAPSIATAQADATAQTPRRRRAKRLSDAVFFARRRASR